MKLTVTKKYPQMNIRKNLSYKFLGMCEFISQNYTYVLWSSPLTLSLKSLRTASLDRIEAYADKENLSVQNVKKAF